MLLVQYSPKEADAVLKMMGDHIDYAPEFSTPRQGDEDIAYFIDSFVEETDGSLAYVLKDEAGTILSFMTVSKRMDQQGKVWWHITALFVANDANAEANALASIEHFQRSLASSANLCVNVHPSASKAIELWTTNGFSLSPDCSVFSNADGEHIAAFCSCF